MAVGHINYNPQTPHGGLIDTSLTNLETGRDEVVQLVATLIQMKDGANLTSYAVAKFGFSDVAGATAALAELESLKSALDGIASTLNQAFAKFRSG